MDWTAFLTSFGVSGIKFAILGFLARSIILHYLDKDVERYKTQLLQATHEHQIRFNHVYDKQAQIIAELYRKLVHAHRILGSVKLTAAKTFTAEDKQKAELAFKAYWDALSYFDEHALYFDHQVFAQVEALSTEMLKYTTFFSGLADTMERFTPEQRKRLNTEIDGRTLEGVMIDTWKTMDEKTPELLRDLMAEFRRLLGVTEGRMKS